MSYDGIDKCDYCGQPLEEGRSLAGICEACEQSLRRVETAEPTKGVL